MISAPPPPLRPNTKHTYTLYTPPPSTQALTPGSVCLGGGGGALPPCWLVLNSLFQTSSMPSGHHGDSWTKKTAMHDDRVSPLSDH